MDDSQNNSKQDETGDQSEAPTAPLLGVQEPKPTEEGASGGPETDTTPEEPVTNLSSSDSDQPAPANQNLSPVAQNEPAAAQPLDHKTAKPAARKAIVAVIILALILAGVSLFLYTQNKPKDSKQANNTTEQAPQTAAITPQNIDETTKAIDEAITQLDDSKDFPDSELASTTLGL